MDTPTPDEQQAITAAYRGQRLRTYAGNLPLVLAVSSLVAVLLALLLRDRVPAGTLAGWLAAMAGVLALRAGLTLLHRRSPPGRVCDTVWLRRYRMAASLHGLVWASASLVELAPGDLLGETLRALVIVGLVGGNFALLAFDTPAAMLFGAPVMACLSLHLAQLDTPTAHLLAGAGVATLGFYGLASHRAGRVVQQFVTLQVQASRQADALRQSQAALAEKSAALQDTLDSISQGIASMDSQGRLRVFNQRARELLDLPLAVGTEGSDFASLRALQVARGDMPQGGYIDADGQHRPLPVRMADTPARYVRRTRRGGLIEVRSRQQPDGGMVRTYTDVTDDVETQRALAAAKSEAERANQAKSQFLSGMSHELRTPLNAILGFGEVLLADTAQPLAAAHRRQVEDISDGARHLLHLINDLLDLAVVESGRLQVDLAPVALPALVHSGLALVRPQAARAGVRLPAGLGPVADGTAPGAAWPLPVVMADRTRLLQVLLNLLSNAIKYNRAGGRVGVDSHPAPGAPHRLRITVSDDGPGLDADQRARLFEPFERLAAGRSAVEGAGLGLALSRSLARAMGGEIGVDSQPGQGSRFWIDLDRGPASLEEAGPPGQALPMAALRPTDTVLYVEDNAVNALLMEAMLAQLGGPRLVLADTARDGLAQARALRPTLILLDIELPDQNGLAVMQQLALDPDCRHIPVLAVTANAMPEDHARGVAAGFAAYLTKPLTLQALGDALARTTARPMDRPPP